jgi:hypothetical protein
LADPVVTLYSVITSLVHVGNLSHVGRVGLSMRGRAQTRRSFSALRCAMRSRSSGHTGMLCRKAVAWLID